MSLEVKTYEVMSDCIEAGIRFGLALAFKHSAPPDAALLQRLEENLHREIMTAISEKFHYTHEQKIEQEKES